MTIVYSSHDGMVTGHSPRGWGGLKNSVTNSLRLPRLYQSGSWGENDILGALIAFILAVFERDAAFFCLVRLGRPPCPQGMENALPAMGGKNPVE